MFQRLLLVLVNFVALCIQAQSIELDLELPQSDAAAMHWIALDATDGVGSTIVEGREGRRLFLPFQADVLIALQDERPLGVRVYHGLKWSNFQDAKVSVSITGNHLHLAMDGYDALDRVRAFQSFTVSTNGEFALDHSYASRSGEGDVYLPFYYTVADSGDYRLAGRYGEPDAKPRIYQMLPRLFGNENETRKTNGTVLENGTGKFSDLSPAVLEGFKEDGFTHIWLTGVLQQATSTDYSSVGQKPDDPDLLKGIAGSPYAIRDYFDVSPDYADTPGARLDEFRDLAIRMEDAGIALIIDFVPNHVARSYRSDIYPDWEFGNHDRRSAYFDPRNNFFYLTPEIVQGGAPLRLPTVDHSTGRVVNETAQIVGGADGYFAPERHHGRVTGNNVANWSPSNGDWYETVKLNYGFDFLNPGRAPEYPSAVDPKKRIPDTWRKMDVIIAYWQSMGVDGFRSDMSHMVPPEFWKWLIHRAKERNPDVFFCAEAYNDDPAKVPSRDPSLRPDDSVMLALLDAGFNAVYDDPGYDTLEHLMSGKAWANDLDDVQQGLNAFFFDCALRYAENHDEIRLAHPDTWGGQGKHVGRPVSATLFGLSRGPVMIYHGQEVGEPGLGVEGFGGDDQRTTIFDYWSLPELNKWWNSGSADGALLSEEQRELRAWYTRLLQLQSHPAFSTGNSYLLNLPNRANPYFGKVEDIGPSGHWLHAYVRSDPAEDSHFLVTSNFHPSATLRHVRVRLPQAVTESLHLERNIDQWLIARDRLANDGQPVRAIPVAEAIREGIYLDNLKPLSAYYWELSTEDAPDKEMALSPVLKPGRAYLGAPPVICLRGGEMKQIDLRRFGNPGSTHRFAALATDGIGVDLDPLNHQLKLSVAPGVNGPRIIPLSLEPITEDAQTIESRLTLVVESTPTFEFKLNGYQSAGSVSLVGDFNGWNTNADLMEKTPKGWTLSKVLNAGIYRYKYIIDGNWVTDPDNDQREADGYGGHNSLASIGEGGPNAEPATVFVSQVTAVSIVLQSNKLLQSVIAEALPQSGGVIPLSAQVNGQEIVIAKSPTLVEPALIRVLAIDETNRCSLPVIARFQGDSIDDWRDDIIYYAFTDRFYDGNTSNSNAVNAPDVADAANYQGGDFEGIRKKLESNYFEELGVNVIWLAPLNQNPMDAWKEYLPPYRSYTGYHGYWPVERYGVEQRFGGEEDLQQLIETAHERDMKVLADLVLKHVHASNPIRTERPDLFGQLELSDGSRNLRRWNDNPYTTWFEPFLPAFDFRNPEAVEFLLEDASYWIHEYKLDGYRLDAVKHIRPDFWWRFRTRMRDAFPEENHYFVGETFQSREGIADFVGANMLDGQFDFPLYDVLVPCFAQHAVSFADLETALRASEQSYGRTVRMSALVGNHDKPRFMAYADGDLPDANEPDDEEVGWSRTLQVDDPASYAKLKMALTFLFTIDGIPMIYYGDEIGMTGAGDPDNRRMMRFGQDVSADEMSVRAHFSTVAKARRKHPALYQGSRRVLVAGEDVYAYIRAYDQDRALIVFNRSSEVKVLKLKLAPEISSEALSDVLSGTTAIAEDGHISLRLEPMQSAIYVN